MRSSPGSGARRPCSSTASSGPEHALVAVAVGEDEAQRAVAATLPEVEVAGAGTTVEIIKEAVRPAEFVARFDLDAITGTHALGHTRMATESRVTTAGSHPFSTGGDVCLVHNGSLSNHNRLRERAAQPGDRVPDGERHRGRGRLRRLAHARG